MRRYIGAIVVLGVFIVLLAFVLLTQGNNNAATTTAVSATPTLSQAQKDLQILTLPATETISQLDIKTITGTTTLKFENNAWKQVAPTALELDSSVISDTVSQFKNLTGSTLIPADKAGDLKTFGLDNPPLIVTLTTAGSGVKTLNFGSANPATKNYYLKLGDDARVWTVNSSLVDTITGWLTKPPTPAPTPAPVSNPLTPLPSVTPSPTAGTPTVAPEATTTPPASTVAPTTTAAATTAPVTTAPPTTTS
jgi:hypothetical protein